MWWLCGLWALAQEPLTPSPAARYEVHALVIDELDGGFDVVRAGRPLDAAGFSAVVGDSEMSMAITRQRARSRRQALVAMALSAGCISGGSWTLARGVGQGATVEEGLAARRQVVVGSVVALAGIAGYALTATVMIGVGQRRLRVDHHYSRDDAEDWMQRYHRELLGEIGVDQASAEESLRTGPDLR